MTGGRSRFALVFAALALAAPSLFAEDPRIEDRVAVVTNVTISGEMATLTLADDSTIELPAAEIRIRQARARDANRRQERSAAAPSADKRDRSERSARVLRARDLESLVATAGPQSLLLRFRYDTAGRIRAARGELHATEAAAIAAMSVRAERREAAEYRKAKPAEARD